MLIKHSRYGAVVRGANAYVPPGARKTTGANVPAGGSVTPTKPEIPKVQVNAPDGAATKEGQKPASPAPGGAAASTVSSLGCLPLVIDINMFGLSVL